SQELSKGDSSDVFRPGIVHRIDKDTSGLLMVAKTDVAHASLAKQLFDKTIKRRYVAIVQGTILEDEGEIIAPIGRDPKNRKKMLVTSKNSKNAETDFFVIERFQRYTLIECQLKTGRTHQIRVHMKYISHPLVGDPVYGHKTTIDTKGQALHAKILGFVHPTTNEYMEFEAPLPEEFINTLNIIKGE
ncbi:MAG: RluA family pseudouridine synthase, partial [Mycoplasmatales bacterium]